MVKMGNEPLIRPDGHHRRIGDTIGAYIAWSSTFVINLLVHIL